MVDVVVVTYNQEKYIAKALQSILEQECEFNYRIIIGEDCSQDNTLQICKDFYTQYPVKILLINNKTNYGLVRNYMNVFSHCSAKYIALLEGDDYWIDPLKLQRQVTLLESDSTLGLVHTASLTLFSNGKMKRNHLSIPHHMLEGDLYETLMLKRNTISPMTVLFRKDLLDKYIDFEFFIEKGFRTIDYPMWLAISRHSQVAYIDIVTAVYRSLEKSVSRPGNLSDIEDFFKTNLEIKRYYFDKYPISGTSEKEVLSPTYFILAESAIKHNEFDKAREYASEIVPKGIRKRCLKLAIDYNILFFLYKVFIILLPVISKIKQFIFNDLMLNGRYIRNSKLHKT